MAAEGLLCRQYLGWKRDHPALIKGAAFLDQHPINYETQDEKNTNVYYWYYATQVLHHMEGTAWEKWNAVLRKEVPARQVTTGKERGSWNPTTDVYDHSIGRLYVTCLSIYMLEVYYRHLPLYSYSRGDTAAAN